MTTPMRPKTAYSGYLRAMTRIEQDSMAITLRARNKCVRPHGTIEISLVFADVKRKYGHIEITYYVCSL